MKKRPTQKLAPQRRRIHWYGKEADPLLVLVVVVAGEATMILLITEKKQWDFSSGVPQMERQGCSGHISLQ